MKKLAFFLFFAAFFCGQTAAQTQKKLNFTPQQITEISIKNESTVILEGKLAETTLAASNEETITFFAVVGEDKIPVKIKMWPQYGHFYVYWGSESASGTLQIGITTLDKKVSYSTQNPWTGENPGGSTVVMKIVVQK